MFRFQKIQSLTFWAGAVVFVLCTSTITPTLAGDPARELFLRQYLPYATKLQSDYINIKLRYKETYELGNGRLQVSEMEGRYNLTDLRLEGKVQLFDKTKMDNPLKTYTEVSCFNPRYSFTLRKGLNDQYKTDRLELEKPSESCFFLAPIAEYQIGKTFLEMAQDSAVSFISLSDRNWQNQAMKELKVKFKRKFSGSNKIIEMNPSYFFSSEDSWICHGAQYSTADPNVFYEKRYSYAPKNGERYPDLKSIEGWLVDKKNPDNSRRKHHTEIIEFAHLAPFAESEFTLSAFGLPEPMGVHPLEKPSQTWIWLVAALIFAVALALLFAWLKRRYVLKSALGNAGLPQRRTS